MFKLSYIMGLGKTTGGKTSIIGYIIPQKVSIVNIFFEIFKKGYIYQILHKIQEFIHKSICTFLENSGTKTGTKIKNFEYKNL